MIGLSFVCSLMIGAVVIIRFVVSLLSKFVS